MVACPEVQRGPGELSHLEARSGRVKHFSRGRLNYRPFSKWTRTSPYDLSAPRELVSGIERPFPIISETLKEPEKHSNGQILSNWLEVFTISAGWG